MMASIAFCVDNDNIWLLFFFFKLSNSDLPAIASVESATRARAHGKNARSYQRFITMKRSNWRRFVMRFKLFLTVNDRLGDF